LALVAPFVGTFTYLEYQKKIERKKIKRAIMAGVDRAELVLLSFSKQEATHVLKWKHSKEFQYKNEMYDVVETLDSGDSIQYYCWWDHKETALNKKVTSLLFQFLNTDPNTQDSHLRLAHFCKNVFHSNPISLGFGSTSARKEKWNTGWYHFYESYFRAPDTPPPAFVV